MTYRPEFRWLKLALAFQLSLGTMACTYVNAVSQTNLPQQRRKVVRAQTQRYIFLGFNFDNDYPYRLIDRLKSQCPDGRVRGLLTKDTTTLYFLFFFWSREQLAEGYCVVDAKNDLAAVTVASTASSLTPEAQNGSELDDRATITNSVEILEP